MIDSVHFESFRRLCEESQRFVLTTHINPDGDAIGSQSCLSRFLASLGKQVRVVNQDPTPEVLRFIEDPNARAEPYDPARHDRLLNEADLVVLLDNSAPDRLGSMEDLMVGLAGKILCLDHHPSRDAPWAHSIVDMESCATTAVIWELATACGWQPDLDAAKAIYAGLATDTGFFRFNSTNARAYDIAAALLRTGVRPDEIYKRIYERNSLAFTRLLGHALTEVRLDAGGAVASVKITRRLIESLHAQNEDPAEITTTLLAMDGVLVAALYRELPDGRVKVSLRSKGALDVHRLAMEFGGGGHRNASGIVMSGDLQTVVDTVNARAAVLLAKAPE
jgi:phosphoesterase RecJ-like protein